MLVVLCSVGGVLRKGFLRKGFLRKGVCGGVVSAWGLASCGPPPAPVGRGRIGVPAIFPASAKWSSGPVGCGRIGMGA